MKKILIAILFFIALPALAETEEAPVPACVKVTEYMTVKLVGAGFEAALVDRINYFAGLVDATHKSGKLFASGDIAGANTATLESETCPASSVTCTTAGILTAKVNQYRTFLTAMSKLPITLPRLNFSYLSCAAS